MPTDLSTDKDFAALPLSQKFAYLGDTDPDFKSLSPGDQQAYVNHVTKVPGAPESTPDTTDFEQKNAAPSTPAWERIASGAWNGAKAMLPSFNAKPTTEDVALSGFGPLPKMAINAVRDYKQQRASGQGVIPSIGSAVGSSVGLDSPGIRERAQRGDVAGVTGEAIPSIAATVLGGERGNISDVAGDARSSVMRATRDPYTGKLLPRVREGAQLAGAGIGALGGSLLGGEGALGGGYAGFRVAPALTDLVLPKNPIGQFSLVPKKLPPVEVPVNPQEALGAFMNKGYRSIPSVEEAAAEKRRLTPLVYESDAHYNQVKSLNDRLENEASKAGMYSAARGAVNKTKDYQERIGTRTQK